MLIGEYLHTIDQKNRLSVPSKFRKELGKIVVVSRGLDKCLFLYPLLMWEKLAQKLSTELPSGKAENRQFMRSMVAGASDIEIDALGRILLPENLKQFASLDKEAMVVGLFNRVEIWNPEIWKTYSESANQNTELIAEKLGELGMY